MTPEGEINNQNEQLASLATELESILEQVTAGKNDDPLILKLIQWLRTGDAEGAKVLVINEADKFAPYRKDMVPLIVKKLFNGTGSPWIAIEKQLKDK